ncbi:MAG TPA: hypothetical protein VER96_13645 [Polyangiaceae bacterium]|nr:hypothetical protein [Polyangiaceae bacterium]
MSLRVRCTLTLFALVSLSSNPARAQNAVSASAATAACVHAYEQAQEERQVGKLLEARAHLQSCAQDTCPSFIRSDCGAWYQEVQAEVPNVVFSARGAGRDLTDVGVSSGQQVLASRLDGEAVELDPGEYDLQFTAPGMQPVTQHVRISRGERTQRRVEFVRLPQEPSAGQGAASLPPPGPRSAVLPAVFGGVAVIGLAGFAVFGTRGRSAESRLETTCSPHCSEDQISSVRTQYAVADVSLAVGLASLGLAAYFALSPSSERRAARAASFDVQASARAVGATYQVAF